MFSLVQQHASSLVLQASRRQILGHNSSADVGSGCIVDAHKLRVNDRFFVLGVKTVGLSNSSLHLQSLLFGAISFLLLTLTKSLGASGNVGLATP
jgi:hypothetical protein